MINGVQQPRIERRYTASLLHHPAISEHVRTAHGSPHISRHKPALAFTSSGMSTFPLLIFISKVLCLLCYHERCCPALKPRGIQIGLLLFVYCLGVLFRRQVNIRGGPACTTWYKVLPNWSCTPVLLTIADVVPVKPYDVKNMSNGS